LRYLQLVVMRLKPAGGTILLIPAGQISDVIEVFNYVLLLLSDNSNDMTTKDIDPQDFLLKPREYFRLTKKAENRGQRYKDMRKHIL